MSSVLKNDSPDFKEDFLHYIWKYRLFQPEKLFLVNGEPFKIINPGWHNKDSGPDFFNATLIIDETKWAGNIEIHKKTSDWDLHHHHSDPAYSNVILHVVYEHNKALAGNGKDIPVFELKEKIFPGIILNYNKFRLTQDYFPCKTSIAGCEKYFLRSWLDAVMIEKLEQKCNLLSELLIKNSYNTEETLFQFLCRSFGFNINSQPFEMLASKVTYKWIRKYGTDLQLIESMLFGQAGLLRNGSNVPYEIELLKGYNYLKVKFQLEPMAGSQWKMLRLRPSNFPHLRIAQLASLLQKKSTGLLDSIIDTENLESYNSLLAISASEFWDTHYSFDGGSKIKKKEMGISSRQLLLINAIIPFLFFYGKEKGIGEISQKALDLLTKIKPEHNFIIREWINAGVPPSNAMESQSILFLDKNYCKKFRCLDCGIGNYLLRKS